MSTTTTPFSNESCTNTLWSGTFWLAYGSSGIIAKSTDGVNWTVQTTVTTKITGTIVNVIKQGTRYLAYSATQASASVNDGINWTSYTSTNTETKLNTINGGLSYSTDRFILFGGNTNPINPGVALAYFTTQWHDVDITGNGGISLKLMFTPDILIPKMIFSDNDFFYYELTYNSVFELIKLTDITSNTGDFTNQILKAGGNLYVVDPNGPSVHESTDQGTNWNTDKINTANITSLSGIILSAKGTLFAWGANDSGDFTFYVNNDSEWTVTTGFTPRQNRHK